MNSVNHLHPVDEHLSETLLVPMGDAGISHHERMNALGQLETKMVTLNLFRSTLDRRKRRIGLLAGHLRKEIGG